MEYLLCSDGIFTVLLWIIFVVLPPLRCYVVFTVTILLLCIHFAQYILGEYYMIKIVYFTGPSSTCAISHNHKIYIIGQAVIFII